MLQHDRHEYTRAASLTFPYIAAVNEVLLLTGSEVPIAINTGILTPKNALRGRPRSHYQICSDCAAIPPSGLSDVRILPATGILEVLSRSSSNTGLYVNVRDVTHLNHEFIIQ